MKLSVTSALIASFILMFSACTSSTNQSGNYIVYSASSDDTKVNLYLVDIKSGDKKQLTNMKYANYPSWSSDGKKIVFSSSDGLYFIDENPINLTKIIDTPNFEIDPIWSPDGSRIAFISQHLDDQSLYDLMIVNVDGTGLITIARNLGEPDNSSSFSWSPDGKKIALSHPFEESREIVVVNADGSGLTQVTNLSSPSYSPPIQPSWSPDGKKIAFVTWDLYIVNADGTGLAKLTEKDKKGFSALTAPRWSPNGRYIACRNGDNIILVNLVNGQVTTINGKYPIADYSWSSRGDNLAYFIHNGNGTLNIETINVNSMQKTQVAKDLGFYPWQSLEWQP